MHARFSFREILFRQTKRGPNKPLFRACKLAVARQKRRQRAIPNNSKLVTFGKFLFPQLSIFSI